VLTFTRAGRTSLFIEDPADSTGFGRLGFLLPDGTAHLPTQLTIEDAWFWKNDTLGAGWFIFLADGMSFPDPVRESRLLDVFLASLRARLPRGTTTLSSGFVWVAGDTRTPLTMSVVRLDVIGVRGRRQNATTVRSTQTFSFQQFQVTIN
jgi:hypothetical protein